MSEQPAVGCFVRKERHGTSGVVQAMRGRSLDEAFHVVEGRGVAESRAPRRVTARRRSGLDQFREPGSGIQALGACLSRVPGVPFHSLPGGDPDLGREQIGNLDGRRRHRSGRGKYRGQRAPSRWTGSGLTVGRSNVRPRTAGPCGPRSRRGPRVRPDRYARARGHE